LFLLYEEVHPDTVAANRGRVRIHTAPGYQPLWEQHYIIPDLGERDNEEAGPSRRSESYLSPELQPDCLLVFKLALSQLMCRRQFHHCLPFLPRLQVSG
jgi:hypothetical protein